MRISDFDFYTAYALRMAIHSRIIELELFLSKDPEVIGELQTKDWTRQLVNLRKLL